MQSITLGLLWWKKNYPKLKQEQKFIKTEVNEDNKIQKDPLVGPKNNIEMLCKLVKEHSAPQVDLEPFDGNNL